MGIALLGQLGGHHGKFKPRTLNVGS